MTTTAASTQVAPAEPGAPGWQISFGAVWTSQFIAVIGFSMFVPFLPLYLADLGVPDSAQQALWSGAIFGVTPLLSGLASPFWGSLGDKFSLKLMLVRAQNGWGRDRTDGLAPAVWLFAFRVLQGLVGGNRGRRRPWRRRCRLQAGWARCSD
ncbi:MAG: hypothetical protein U0556_14210 [Dehalococcoidia bacterium]